MNHLNPNYTEEEVKLVSDIIRSHFNNLTQIKNLEITFEILRRLKELQKIESEK